VAGVRGAARQRLRRPAGPRALDSAMSAASALRKPRSASARLSTSSKTTTVRAPASALACARPQAFNSNPETPRPNSRGFGCCTAEHATVAPQLAGSLSDTPSCTHCRICSCMQKRASKHNCQPKVLFSTQTSGSLQGSVPGYHLSRQTNHHPCDTPRGRLAPQEHRSCTRQQQPTHAAASQNRGTCARRRDCVASPTALVSSAPVRSEPGFTSSTCSANRPVRHKGPLTCHAAWPRSYTARKDYEHRHVLPGPNLQPQLVDDCRHGRRLARAHWAGDPSGAAAQAARLFVGVQLLRVLQPDRLNLGRYVNTQSAGRPVCCSMPLALRRRLGRMQPHSGNLKASAKHMSNTSATAVPIAAMHAQVYSVMMLRRACWYHLAPHAVTVRAYWHGLACSLDPPRPPLQQPGPQLRCAPLVAAYLSPLKSAFTLEVLAY